MNFLILFLLFATIIIDRISADQHCIEQECSSNMSHWCCLYNTTCGSENTCNEINQASRQSYCPGGIPCFSNQYYWCCNNDQTCGDFRECKGDNGLTISIIVVLTIIGSAILIAVCLIYIRYRCSGRTHNNQMMHISSTNLGATAPIYLFPNSSMTQPNSYGEVHPIPMSSATTFNREEPPPNYDAIIVSSTIQNQNKV